MSNVLYSIVQSDLTTAVTVVHDGEVYVADNTHPNFESIVKACLADDPSVTDLFDVTRQVQQYLDRLSNRVAVANGRVYFDGDEVDNSLTRQMLRFLESGVGNWAPLVFFMENLAQNPSPHSREQLYDWLKDRDFTLTSDGCFLAYKGVIPSGEGYYLSISSGSAYVNDELVTGQIRQEVGDVVTMGRSKVAFDPGVGCSTGLHAGTWEYASDFARGAVLTVKINPRDVVSVPTDCEAQKLRVCRYEIVSEIEVEYNEPVWDDEESDGDWQEILHTDHAEFDSTLLKEAYFDAASQLCFVIFNGETSLVYAYNMTARQWSELLMVHSPGQYFNLNVKRNLVSVLDREDIDFVKVQNG